MIKTQLTVLYDHHIIYLNLVRYINCIWFIWLQNNFIDQLEEFD